MKAHQDLSDRKVTEAETEFWLRQVGEPTLINATRDRQFAEGQHYDKTVEPLLIERRRANAASKRAAFAALREANEDDIAIEATCRSTAPRDLQRHVSSMVIPDLDMWIAHEDRRASAHWRQP